MKTRRQSRKDRVNRFFGDMVSQKTISTIIDGPKVTKKQISEECKSILESLGYRNIETMSRGSDEYKIEFR